VADKEDTAVVELEGEETALEVEKDVAAEPNRIRTKAGARQQSRKITQSNIPYPVEIHGEDFEFYGPAGFAAVPVGDKSESGEDQEFYIDEEKLEFLSFDVAGRNLPKKRLYNIKAIHKDGRIVQLPFEPQVQNNAGGDPEDAIGLRRYQRKGIHLLILDWETMRPIYCAAWDCWAQALDAGPWVAFCSQRHAQHTLPNRYKDADAIVGGLMEQGVTTTRTWSV
jgi:hypothetical protein